DREHTGEASDSPPEAVHQETQTQPQRSEPEHDTEDHERVARVDESAEPNTAGGEDHESPSQELSSQALMRAGRYAEAADVMEAELSHARGTDAQTLRLDLARVYLRFLDEPGSAAPLLREALEHGLDATFERVVLDQLCGLNDSRDDERCGR
ncbi:MAG: hypothetical protein KC561_16115, partial [Myxococcales bacterium]|nr:hypothetical protein [Myxococcales bacterium]